MLDKTFIRLVSLLIFTAALSACTALGLTVPAVAVSGGAAGVDYTFTNNAYKTISHPLPAVETALDRALNKMDIRRIGTANEKDTVSISAVAGRLDIDVELERITPRVTRIEVSARQSYFIKDKATATEIIVQTEKSLESASSR